MNITKGLLNPYSGPYTYTDYLLQVQTSLGFSIDSLSVSNDSFASPSFTASNPFYTSPISVACLANCTTCSGSLSFCASCAFNNSANLTLYLNSGACTEQCPAGEWGDPSDFTCK